MKSDLGADTYKCDVCEKLTITRFGVCKECDDAFWLTEMSKKQNNPQDHSVYDIKHIKKCMLQRANIIQELIKG